MTWTRSSASVPSRADEELPADPAALFRYLLAQDAGTLGELLALHVARSIDAIQSRKATRRIFKVADAIVNALDLDMADWWMATPARYLESVPKAKMIEAVTKACGEAEAYDLAKMKPATGLERARPLARSVRLLLRQP